MINSYHDAVQTFIWPVEASNSTVDGIVNAVADQIKAAKQIKNFIPGGQNLPLAEIYSIIAKDLDRKYQTHVPSLIYNASNEEKSVAKRVFIDLTQRLDSDSDVDLQSATLLFGITKIHDFVQSKLGNAESPGNTGAPAVQPMPNVSVEALEALVIQMQGMKAQLAGMLASATPQQESFFKAQLAKVDQMIAQKLQEIQTLKDL